MPFVPVAPATPADNHALLTAAIACDDPVIYMEHKELWALQDAVHEDLDVDRTLVGFDDRDHVAPLNTRAGCNVPLEDRAPVHVRARWPAGSQSCGAAGSSITCSGS